MIINESRILVYSVNVRVCKICSMSVVYGLGALKMQMMIMSGALLNGLCLRTLVRYIYHVFCFLTVILKCKFKRAGLQLLLLTPIRWRSTCMTV
jgi:hypothetical protein